MSDQTGNITTRNTSISPRYFSFLVIVTNTHAPYRKTDLHNLKLFKVVPVVC